MQILIDNSPQQTSSASTYWSFDVVEEHGFSFEEQFKGTEMQIGDVVSWERTFTEDDIRLFARFSGDEGQHHLIPDQKGRLMAHGLLTATLPTKIGGDINFIAQEMNFQFSATRLFRGHDKL